MHTCTGTVYKIQREYSLADIRETLTKIRDNGMKTVVIWPAVFWWEDSQKPGYPYNTGRAILDYAQELGLKIIMETAGQIPMLEYAPDFVMKDEYLPVTIEGLPRNHLGSYGFLNYFHPEVAALVERQLAGVCGAYRDHPALYGYDIFNETMFESYDRYTLERFRQWLQKKYGTIERLNEVWDRVYYDWSQVEFTRWIWASVMPVADLLEFQKDAVGMQLAQWRDIVHREDPNHPAIADNLYSMFCGRPEDDEWVTDENVDELGMSYYPKNSVPAFAPHKRWQMLRGFHSVAKERRFWVSEMQTHTQSAYRPSTAVSVKELRTWTWECYAGGSKGIVYWKWRPFTKGLQTTGRGLVDYHGNDTPRSLETREIARVLRENEHLFDHTLPEAPKAAILYDRLNLAIQRAYTVNYGQSVEQQMVHESVEGLSKCLFDANVPANFVRPCDVGEQLAAQYPVLFVTSQMMVSAAISKALRDYAKAGGTVVIDGKFGFVNEDAILLDAIPGGEAMQELLKLDWVDVDAQGQHLSGSWNGKAFDLCGSYERQLYKQLDGFDAQVLASFDDGYPALVRRACGKGSILIAPTALWYGYLKEGGEKTLSFMNLLADQLGMRTYRLASDAIRTFVSRGDAGELVYAFNYAQSAQEATLHLPAHSGEYEIRELRSGEKCKASADSQGVLTLSIEIDDNDVAIYAITRV